MAKLCDGSDQPQYAFGDYFFPTADGLNDNINLEVIINNVTNLYNIIDVLNQLFMIQIIAENYSILKPNVRFFESEIYYIKMAID